MLPSTSVKGRKRKRNGKGKGGAGDVDDDDAMDILERFKLKLAQAAESTDYRGDASSQGKAEAPDTLAVIAPVPTAIANDEEEEYQLCDLHFIPHCQSCKSWDEAHARDVNTSATNDDDVSPEDFLGHTLRFEKDKLGKDLNWKKEHDYDDGLVVIDPLEKGRELAEQARGTGRGGRGGGGGSGSRWRDWDRNREWDRNRDHRGGMRGG